MLDLFFRKDTQDKKLCQKRSYRKSALLPQFSSLTYLSWPYKQIILFFGEVTEWLKVLAWNAGVGKPTEGSNPSFTVLFIGLVVDADGRVPVTVDP